MRLMVLAGRNCEAKNLLGYVLNSAPVQSEGIKVERSNDSP